MWIWPFRRVDSVVFAFSTKFGSKICYSHWDRHTYASNLNLMTSRELTSGFDFWHVVIFASPWFIFPYNLMQDIFIQSKVIDIFPKLKMAAAAILNFQFMRRVGRVVFVFCTKFGSNICYSHWDPRTSLSGTTRFEFSLVQIGRTVRPVAFPKKPKKRKKRQWQTGYSPRPPTSPYRSQSLHGGWPPVCSSIFQVLLKSVQWFCRCGWSKIALPHYFGHWLIQLVLLYKPW